MKQQIYIQGMTCDNCRKGVTEKMSSIPGISEVEVSKTALPVSNETSTSLIPGMELIFSVTPFLQLSQVIPWI